MADFHVGETATAEVTMRDAGGAVTTDYDVLGGIQYTSTDPAVAVVSDEDAVPTDAVVSFVGLSAAGADVFIEASFDGRVGPDEHRVTLRSEAIHVVAGPAVAGDLVLRFNPV